MIGRSRWSARTMTAALVASAVLSARAAAQNPQVPVSPQTPPAANPDYTFPTGAGMLFFYVKPEKTSDFEAVIGRLADVLDKTADPLRKQQAAGWHMMRSVEAIKDAAVYVFVFDPAVAGADYDPVKVLSDALPAEVKGLYTKLRESIVRVERMGLVRVR